MANMDFESCYKALELPFGVGLGEVNERWRKLSRIHHPDRHARNPKNYQIALERQKQLNNARDILKKWFETNPHAAPPRSTSSSQQTQNKSANAHNQNNNSNANKSQSNNSNSQTKQGTQNKHQSHASQNQRQTNSLRILTPRGPRFSGQGATFLSGGPPFSAAGPPPPAEAALVR